MLCLLVVALAIVGCGTSAPIASPPKPPPDQITQFSIINALLLSQYDGKLSVGDLKQYGDFGLGTFDHLDGEMIVLDGIVYQAKGDGTVTLVADDLTTPFAIVTPFASDGALVCESIESLQLLDEHLDGALGAKNAFVALRMEVQLDEITVRSVPRQEPPYLPLAEVTKTQPIWTHKDIAGTLVGIYCPAWTSGVSVPGYHWHFLSRDKQKGGHVIDLRIRSGDLTYDRCDTWLVKLDSVATAGQNLGQDLSQELEQVERQRGDGK